MKFLLFIFLSFLCSSTLIAQISFSVINLPSSVSSKNLFSISAQGSNLYIAGDGCLLKSINNGNSWSIMLQNNDIYFFDVKFANNNIGYAVGWQKGADALNKVPALYKTNDEGKTWDLLYTSTRKASASTRFSEGTMRNGAIDLLDASRLIWGCGTAPFYSVTGGRGNHWVGTSVQTYAASNPNLDKAFLGSSGLLESSKGGVSFGTSGYSTSDYYDFDLVSPDDLYAVSGGAANEIYKIKVNQNNTSSSKSITGSTANDKFYGIDFLDLNYGFVVGKLGKVAFTQNGGNTWTQVAPITSEQLNDIHFYSNNQAILIGNNGTVLRLNSNITSIASINSVKPFYKESDIKWSTITSGTNNDLYEITHNDGNVFVVGDGIILKSTNQGSTFTTLISDANLQFRDVTFVSANIGWVIAYNIADNKIDVYKTFNGGLNWTYQTSLPGKSAGVITGLVIEALNSNFVLASYADALNSVKKITYDGGLSWSNVGGNFEIAPISDFVFFGTNFTSSGQQGYGAKRTGGGSYFTSNLANGAGNSNGGCISLTYTQWPKNYGMNAIVTADNHLVIARDMEFSSTSQTQAGMIERTKIPYPNTASDWACYPTYSAVHYYGVHMFSSNDIWLCGEKGTIITTRNQNGGIISGSSAPNPHKEWFGHQTNIYDNLYSITAVNSDIVIAVGQNGKIIKTSNASSVNNLITTCENPISPTFTLVNPVCEGDFLDNLSTLSLENITGTWSPTINNKQTTIYTFTPTIRQCATTTTMKIEVVPIITPIFTEIASICSGHKLAELPLVSNNGINGTWSPGINNVKTTNYTFTPTKGQCAISTNMTIIVNPTPEIATLSGPSVICIGTSDTLIPSITGGQWASSNSNIATVNNGIIKGILDGTVDISYTLADGQCTSKTTTTIAINNLPEVATLTGSSVVCLGSSSTLIPSITGGQWTSSNTNIVTVNEGLIQGVLNGTVDISYTLGGNGCNSSVSKAITVETKPVFPQISGPSKICWNGKAMMRASVAGGVWGVENNALLLASPQGLFRNSVRPSSDNFKSGVNYTVKSRLGACSSKVVKNVYVRNVTAPNITITSAKTNLKVNEITVATANTAINSVGTWSSTNTVVGATVNFSNKTATVKALRVGNGANLVYFADDITTGCRQAGYIAFTVTAAASMVENESNTSSYTTDLIVYPNPSNGMVTIENIGDAKTISLIDVTGRELKTTPVNADRMRLDYSTITKGNYFISIQGETIKEMKSIVIE